jgi:hypothetical protein
MNPKITASALKQMQGKCPDEFVLLTLRTNVVLTEEEIALLTGWGGKLLYDCGNLVLLYIPAAKVNDIAGWQCVLEVR